jgi:flagellar FliL protein
MTMAITDETEPVKKGPSMVIQIVILLVLTLVALGLGWGAGMYLKKQATPVAADAAPAATPVPEADHGKTDEHGAPAADAHKEGEKPVPGAPVVVALEPITTNLAAPNKTWVRLEAAVVFDGPAAPGMADLVQQDILAYMRNVKLHQIEGPSGFQHLRADLDERARVRSDGHVTQVLIRTLLFE